MERGHKIMALMVLCIMVMQGFGVGEDSKIKRRLLQTGGTDPGTVDCPSKCDARCALARRADRCIQYCMICCDKCKCVSSGTSGYIAGDCDCYAKLKNSKGGHKCP
ncbi:cypmaclein isoform X2 [Cryptomeria japonica]|uniref:cypmaclein isoform X2 n=1 Tax=Cryptomeria japonica TaxID=3369 RepID=UPI0025ACFF82|nr:cypmaclein isoform X2 [Cryptomeria japonica]